MVSLICGILETKQMRKTERNQTLKYGEQTGGCQRDSPYSDK